MSKQKIVRFIRCFYYQFSRNELLLRASALTYYAVLSIFPLLILITSLMGIILRDPAKQQATIDALIRFIPAGAEIITNLLQKIIASRTASSIIAFLTLMWSASGFLRGLLATIDLIHSEKYSHNTLFMRSMGALVILLTIPALFLLLIITKLSALVFGAIAVEMPGFVAHILNILASRFAIFVITTTAFFLMMRYIPSKRPPTRTSLISASITSVAWIALGYAFAWYLSSDFSNYNVIYGSIGAMMALMLYLYLTNVIILFGAQLNATLAHIETCNIPEIRGLDDLLRKLKLL